MDIKGTKEKIWRHEREGRNGKFYAYTVRVSKKRDDGTWSSMYLPIHFAKKANAPAKISNGARINFEGFLDIDEFGDKKNLRIIAMSMEVVEEGVDADIPDNFQMALDDIPFA